MKKIIALLLCLSLMLLCLSGCASSEPETSVQTATPDETEAPVQEGTADTETTIRYPENDLTMIIPFGAGGGTDTVMRLVASEVEKKFDPSIIILNQPGNYGTLGLVELAKAEADGYTVSGTSVYDVIGGLLMAGDELDLTWEDFEYVCGVTDGAEVFIASPDSGITTFEEFVNYALEHPGELTVSTSGVTHNLLLGILNVKLGLDVTNVPYSSGGDSLNALLGGQVDAALIGSQFALQVDDTYSVLCAMGPNRLASIPDVPSVNEIYPEIELPAGARILVAPKGTPAEIVSLLEELVKEVTDTDTFAAKMSETGNVYKFTPGAELREAIGSTASFLNEAVAENREAFGLS